MRGVYRPTFQNERRATHQKNKCRKSQFQSMTGGAHAYNAGRRSGGSPEVETRTSGTDIYMKRAGRKCSISLVLLPGSILLAVVPPRRATSVRFFSNSISVRTAAKR